MVQAIQRSWTPSPMRNGPDNFGPYSRPLKTCKLSRRLCDGTDGCWHSTQHVSKVVRRSHGLSLLPPWTNSTNLPPSCAVLVLILLSRFSSFRSKAMIHRSAS